MMRSLYSGVSGLRNHQTRMDVIGNNIANVNTVGFKGSRVVFQDLFSQTTKTASGEGTGVGGTNPQQIGLGVSTATVDILSTRSSTQYTGNTLDLAIEGDGYFMIEGNGSMYYTRAGNFAVDTNNDLVAGNGFYVQVYWNPGMEVEGYGEIKEANWFERDGDGNYVKDANGQKKLVLPDGGPSKFTLDREMFSNITIDDNGVITAVAKKDSTNTKPVLDADGNQKTDGDGNPMVEPVFKTDERVTLGVIAMANFNNVDALEKVGGNMYVPTNNSGEAILTVPGSDGAGLLSPGSLEMSNVDLSNEFTDMIITQRGFQANSRIITVSDSMLEELVNLKR